MLRFFFVPLVAVWLGMLSGLWTLMHAPRNVSLPPIAQAKTCLQVEPSIGQATRRDKMKRAVEENIRLWGRQIETSSGEKRALAHYFRAENYYVIGKYHDAIKDLESVPNLAKPVRTSFNAKINNGLGQYEAALKELGQDNYGSEIRAYALLKTNQAKRAIEECNKCIKQQNDNELTYFIRGQAYQALGADQKAIMDFSKSLYKSTSSDCSFVDYLSTQTCDTYDITTELRLLHNAAVYQRRAISFSRTGKSMQAMQDAKRSAQLGFSPTMDACLSQSGMGTIAP